MADSLDEFFAKKDKTRRGKKKNVTPEEIAKELEVGGRKSDKGQKDKDKSSAVPIVNLKILDAVRAIALKTRSSDFSYIIFSFFSKKMKNGKILKKRRKKIIVV